MATGLLVKVRADGRGAMGAAAVLGPCEPILTVPPGDTPPDMGLAPDQGATWVRMEAQENPWDRAHSLMAGGFGAAEAGVIAAEPDAEWVMALPADGPGKAKRRGARALDGYPDPAPPPGWHLDDQHSGLRSARARVERDAPGRLADVRIAHLDTGVDPSRPDAPVRRAAERDVTVSPPRRDAVDRASRLPIYQRGHGTGTVGILAGGDPGPPWPRREPLGGAAGATIIPVRVGDTVVRLTLSTIVKGFDWALTQRAQVLSMSMGGLASMALADAVNAAYGAGTVVVSAAGNYFGAVPSPRSIVYPARMRRVIAATGVMADGRAYRGLDERLMQGCAGPEGKMATALAAWTPQVPWPELGGGLSLDGGGTSAATPQIAAAAALWIALHRARYDAAPGWRKTELVRQALFRSARKTTAALDAARVFADLGQGTLDAAAALNVVVDLDELAAPPPASAAWDWLKLLTGEGVGIAASAAAPRERLLGLEVLHAVHRHPELEAALGGADPDGPEMAPSTRRRFLEALLGADDISRTLKVAIESALGLRAPAQRRMPPAPEREPPPGRPASPDRPPAPPRRRLKIFALDPSLGAALKTVDANIATIDVPYETDLDGRESVLRPGPVGEYLEVVDVDPASDRFHPPVDLDDPHLLLTDGLEPSEGSPAFHQQMVYAVAMRTVESFERALGRPALWAPRRRPGEGYGYDFVQRLRIYPHALRAPNAYYSPNKVALLFGYFPSGADARARTPGGSLVFTCLSADVVAHEMTHALLDGYTRGYREDSNPDVGAFHEAFADIVALMQHFRIRDLVRREIAHARGDLSAAGLLAGLARQFGEGARLGGALRDYGRDAAVPDYATTFKVHERGSILVRAVFDAFVAIFDRRAADLIRLATGGSGLLAPGALHPDLVERLTDEACEAAGHVLGMTVRALDFIPHADVTFGDYLRGIVTADLEQVEDDRLRYRTAFLESFRERGLLPRGLRTMSVETLRWPSFADRARTLGLNAAALRTAKRPVESPEWLDRLVDQLAYRWRDSLARETIWHDVERRCVDARRALDEVFAAEGGTEWLRALGVEDALPRYEVGADGALTEKPPRGRTCFEVRTVRGARRARPDGRVTEHILIALHQRRPAPLDGVDVANGYFWFRGMALIVIEPPRHADRPPRLRFVIARELGDGGRLARERAYRTGQTGARAMYFSPAAGGAIDWSARGEPFAALHAGED